jgi:hypothetical protein
MLLVGITVATQWDRRQSGIIQLANDRKYAYTISDRLVSGYDTLLHGIDVEIPSEFPHLYLDAQQSGGRLAGVVIDGSQRISLEGDFDKYFRLYAPRRYETLALSIISPDVMADLIDHAWRYDAELYGSHLRIISNKRISRDAARSAEILAVAESVLRRIDHRLQTWSDTDSRAAMYEDLLMYPLPGVRLAGRFIPWDFLVAEVVWVLLSGLFFWVGVLTIVQRHQPVAVGLLVLLTWITRSGQRVNGFYSRRGRL